MTRKSDLTANHSASVHAVPTKTKQKAAATKKKKKKQSVATKKKHVRELIKTGSWSEVRQAVIFP